MPSITIVAPGKPYDLLIACFVVVATCVLSAVAPSNPINWVLAILSIYFFPGYVITSIVFPGNDLPISRAFFASSKEIKIQMSFLERLVISVITSLIVLSIIGTVLAMSSLLDWQSVTTEILLLTFVCSAIAYRVRSRMSPEKQMSIVIRLSPSYTKFTKWEKVILGFIILAFAIALTVAVIGPNYAPYKDRDAIMELKGVGGDLNTLPRSVKAGNEAALMIAVTNKMNVELSYNLTIGIDNLSSVSAYDRIDWNNTTSLQSGIAFYDEFVLSADQCEEKTFIFSINSPGEYKIIFRLMYGEKVQELWLWVTVME
ncbi:MAG: DUF1616 domain-containing protein [Methanomassiliicoccales archaeon]|nr:DUF1616 domain-containing protein [Methanomassiliicoccales archaeon]